MRKQALADSPGHHDHLATMKQANTPRPMKNFDDARPDQPGKHWLTLGAGLAAWWFTRKHPSMLLRTAGMVAGTALAGRAASGQGGIARVLRYLPFFRGVRGVRGTRPGK